MLNSALPKFVSVVTAVCLNSFWVSASWSQRSPQNSVTYLRQQGLNYRSQKLYPQAIAALKKLAHDSTAQVAEIANLLLPEN